MATMQWAGPDSENAGKARVVKLTLQDGFETWYGVDPESCLIIWSRNFRAFHPDVDPGRKWTETRYADFRSHDGVTRPWLSLNIDLATGDTIGRTRIEAIRTPGG